MARVTLEFDSESAEGKRIIAVLAGTAVAAPAAEAPAGKKAAVKDKPADAPAPAAAPAATEETKAAPEAAAPEAAAASDAPSVTRQAVAELIQASVKNPAIGRAKVVAALETFRDKVKDEHKKEPEIKLPMIPTEQYSALFAAVKKLAT